MLCPAARDAELNVSPSVLGTAASSAASEGPTIACRRTAGSACGRPGTVQRQRVVAGHRRRRNETCRHRGAAGVQAVRTDSRLADAEETADERGIADNLSEQILPESVLRIEGLCQGSRDAPEFVGRLVERLAGTSAHAQRAACQHAFRQFLNRPGTLDSDRHPGDVGVRCLRDQRIDLIADNELQAVAENTLKVPSLWYWFHLHQLVQLADQLIALIEQIVRRRRTRRLCQHDALVEGSRSAGRRELMVETVLVICSFALESSSDRRLSSPWKREIKACADDTIA